MSASAPQPAHELAKQYADSHFVHSSMDFVVKFVAANVSSCVLKTMLYMVKSFYSITFFN